MLVVHWNTTTHMKKINNFHDRDVFGAFESDPGDTISINKHSHRDKYQSKCKPTGLPASWRRYALWLIKHYPLILVVDPTKSAPQGERLRAQRMRVCQPSSSQPGASRMQPQCLPARADTRAIQTSQLHLASRQYSSQIRQAYVPQPS